MSKPLDILTTIVYHTTNTLIEYGGDYMMQSFDDDRPIYAQIGEFIKRDIVSGRLNGGDKLPSIRDMSDRFKVNPNTVQRAYSELEREGITYTQRGMGTFVIEDREKLDGLKDSMARDVVKKFIQSMEELGLPRDEFLRILEEGLADN